MALALCAGLFGGQQALAYNTGHHFDLTRDALRSEGFGTMAISVAQVANWFTDYFNSSPTSTVREDMAKLHFVDMDSTAKLGNYWGWLRQNMRKATMDAKAADDPLKMLMLLGLSLHVVQDFYAHSTWAESHPRGADGSFSTQTWFGGPPPAGLAALKSTNHDAIHKDYYGRASWETSHVSAYVASREWIRAVAQWAGEDTSPLFWRKARLYSTSGDTLDDLNYDHEAAYRISEWMSAAGYDGLWKCSGSGSTADFLAYAAKWTASHDSVFVKQIKDSKVQKLLSDGLTGDAPPTGGVPDVAPAALSLKAVIVRTTAVAGAGGLDTFGDPDLYAKIWIGGGLPYVEAMQLGKTSFNPPWESIAFFDAGVGSVAIKYELWDEDGGLAGDDDPADIKETAGYVIQCQFNPTTHSCTGDVIGVHDTEATAVTCKGTGGDWGSVKFYVTSAPVVKRVITLRPRGLTVGP